jgi:hypothetical protein
MSLGAVNDVAATSMRVQVPSWGVPWCDVTLAEPSVLSGAVRVSIGGATIVGTVVSGGVFDGIAAYRIAAGRGRWGVTVPAKSYQTDNGVKISTVANDVANACGETLSGAPATPMGPHYARASEPASRTLNALFPQAWYVGLDGVTYVGTRATSVYSGTEARTRIEPGVGVIEVATENVTGLLPGVTIDGSQPATDVEYLLDSKRLTVRVYAAASAVSRRMKALKRIIDALYPRLRYAGVYEYRVTTQEGDRFNLQPVRAATGMPLLARVPMRPGVPGFKATSALGALVLVVFADQDPSRPQVISHEAPGGPGWHPIAAEYGLAALSVARQTDAVIAGPFAGTITGALSTLKAGL